MLKPYYAPWWIHTSDPFSVDEEPYNVYMDDDLLSLNDIGLKIESVAPRLWELSGEYAIDQQQLVKDEDGNPKYVSPEWSQESKDFYSVPSNRARYLLDNYKPLEDMQKQSQLHNLDIAFAEKWGYGVDESFEQAGKVGIPGIIATGTEIASSALRSLDAFSENLDLAFEKNFGNDETIYPFSSQDEKDFWKEQYQDKRDRVKKEKEKKEPDKLTFKFLDDINEWAEKTAIKNMKSFEKRHAKDLRYQAYQQYLQNKPVGWFTTFQSPEYFTDTMISMVPSFVVMGATMGAGVLAGAPTAIGVGIIGHSPLEASGTYTEAYTWTKEKTGDEDLARANAAWSTAGYLTIVAATEGLGASKLMKALIPKKIQNSVKNKAFRTLYKGNVSDENNRTVLGKMAEKWKKGQSIDKSTYHALTQPFSESLQEYVQYAGQILTEAGYKDESMNIIDIARMNHPLVDETELHESVVGGGLFGLFGGGGSYLGKKLLYNEDTNRANDILANEYGVDTGVPNVDLSDESVYNVPIIKGDSEPTLENYFKELLYPGSEERVIVSREKASGSRLGNVIKNQKDYTNSAVAEKLAEAIVALGKSEWDKILDNNDNIAKDILDGKIVFQSTRVGTSISSTDKRKLKIKDKGYADSIIKMYESEIAENFEGKEVTPANTRNYLARARI